MTPGVLSTRFWARSPYRHRRVDPRFLPKSSFPRPSREIAPPAMSDETPTGSAPKPSAVEVAKTASNYLRGDITEEFADGLPGFGKPSVQLLKNHGTAPSPNRDPVLVRESLCSRWGWKGSRMKKRRSAEQIVGLRRQADVDLGKGPPARKAPRVGFVAPAVFSVNRRGSARK